jgi:hypothetical protein
VLEVYHRPRDPDRPVVCVDETSKQLVAETRQPIAAKPGQPERYDYEYEYERNGSKRGKTPGAAADQAGRILALT